jgi:hypothetical protein
MHVNTFYYLLGPHTFAKTKNDTEPFTLRNISSCSPLTLFSYADSLGNVWAFKKRHFAEYVSGQRIPTNPFTRENLPDAVIERLYCIKHFKRVRIFHEFNSIYDILSHCREQLRNWSSLHKQYEFVLNSNIWLKVPIQTILRAYVDIYSVLDCDEFFALRVLDASLLHQRNGDYDDNSPPVHMALFIELFCIHVSSHPRRNDYLNIVYSVLAKLASV